MDKKRQLLFFLFVAVFLGIAQSIDSAVLNNYLSDTYHITVTQRTLLEFPRELPGFLVVFIAAALISLGDVRIAAVANIAAAIGMLGMGFLSPDFNVLFIWLLLYSAGQHVYMPMSNSIAMNLSTRENMGKVLGRINGVNTAAFLVTSIILALIFKFFKLDYKLAFGIGVAALFIAGLIIFKMEAHKVKTKRAILIRKEYKLFYYLSIVFGARKQIFITFGPWVLIKVFGQGVSTFAILGFIIAGIGIFIKPWIGGLIDKKGEKFVLMAEAIGLVIVCTGYATALGIEGLTGIKSLALVLTCGFFVADQILAAASMARSTYLKKIALDQEDVSPTLSMGISMDHVVSMVIPVLGGVVWNAFGYEFVFLLGTIIAVGNFYLAKRIKTDKPESPQGLLIDSAEMGVLKD